MKGLYVKLVCTKNTLIFFLIFPPEMGGGSCLLSRMVDYKKSNNINKFKFLC